MPPTRERQATLPLRSSPKWDSAEEKLSLKPRCSRGHFKTLAPPLAYGHLFLTRWISDGRASWDGRPCRRSEWTRSSVGTPAARALGGFPRSLPRAWPRQCPIPVPEPRAAPRSGKRAAGDREEIANGNHA